MKKLGLALGGGGARGCAHIGAIKALEEAKIPISYIAGTSIGALVGGIYAAGHLKNLEAYLTKIKWTDVLAQLDPTVVGNGMFKGKRVVKLINKLIEEKSFQDCQIPFISVATNLFTGQEVRLDEGKLADAIRASISLPGILTTVEREGLHLLDGGVANPLPVNVVKDMGAEVVLAVDLSKEYSHEKKTENQQDKDEKWRLRLGNSKYPNMIDVIEGAMFLMQKAVTEKKLEKYPADLVLSLHLSSARLFDFHKAKLLIQEGYEATKKIIPSLKKMLL